MIKLLFILSIVSLLFHNLIIINTESSILLLAFFIIIIILAVNSKTVVHYDKELFKFNETIYFYNTIKLWYRIKFRENDIKSLLFANLITDIINYKILFIEKLFISNKLKNNEHNNIILATRSRLDKFVNYTKNNLK